MSSLDKKQDNAPSLQSNLQEEIAKNLKRSSQNKRSSSSNTQKMDIQNRNEMEKQNKMMEQNQKRMKQNALKENNEQNKAEIEQQEQLENFKNVKKEQWVPTPVPLENADKFLQQQKIEKELFENQMKQQELLKLLEEKKILDMYKNIPKQKNMKNNSIIDEEGENQNNSFDVEDSQNLNREKDNESQIRKKRKQNESGQQKQSHSQKQSNNKLQSSNSNSNKQYEYNYEQQISVVQDNYDLNGGDRNKTPDMLGFDAYNKSTFVKEKNNQPTKKSEHLKDKNKFEDNDIQGNKVNNLKHDNKLKDIQKNQQMRNSRKFEENDDIYGQELNTQDGEVTIKQQFVQKILPNGMTNHHKEISLSKDFQKIKFELDGDIGDETPTSQIPSTSKSNKNQNFEKQYNKEILDKQIQQKQQNIASELKRQLDQKEANVLRIKQEQLIKEKKLQRQKEEEIQKQNQNQQKSPEKQNNINQIESKKRDSFLQEFKQQFNDLKKEYNYHRQQSKTNLPTQSNEQISSKIELEPKKNKNSSQQKNRYSEKNQQQNKSVKTPFSEQNNESQFLEQGDYDKEIKHQSLSQSGRVVRRTNYLKDVSKFSMKQQPVIEKLSYSKNMKERRKFWERKTNEDFLNQSIEEKATITAISKFKSKLQQNINYDKQYNKEKKADQESPNNQRQKEMQEWSKLNQQEIKLQRELFQMHFETLDKVKEVEEKNNISPIKNLSQNLGHKKNEQKSRINTATSNKSNITNKTQKSTTHIEGGGGNGKNKKKNKQINPISEIENEDDIEASLMNIDNKLSDQKNRILLMTAEIEQSQQPKNPVLRKELLKNPQILEQNPFSFDITSVDKEYLEDEKQKFLTPVANNNHQKSSRLNISRISNVSNSKELNSQILNNRPNSNKTNVTINQINSLSKITPSHAVQPINSHSQVSLVSQFDKLPRISQQNQNFKEINDSDKHYRDSQNQRDIIQSQSQISKFTSKQNSNISSAQSTHNQQKGLIQQNRLQSINQELNQFTKNQKKQIESKNNLKNKEQELMKRFPEFFSDEQPSNQETPIIKNKTNVQNNISTKDNEKQIIQPNLEEQEDDQNANEVQSIQKYNVQQSQNQAPKRQESSKSIIKKQILQQAAPVNPEVVENDKEDLKQWWKQVQKSIERSNENTPSQRIGEDKNNASTISQEQNVSPLKKKIKQDQFSLPVLPSYEKQQIKQTEDIKAIVKIQQNYEQKERNGRFVEQRQGSQNQLEDKDQSQVESKEERKKALLKKFMDECDQDDQQQMKKDTQEQINQNQKKQVNNNINKQKKEADPNRKQLVSIEFEDLNKHKQSNKQQNSAKNNNQNDENKIVNDNSSVIPKQNGNEQLINNKQQLRNNSGNNKSSESLSKNQSNISSSNKLRQKSAENIIDSRNQLKNNKNKNNSNLSSPNGTNKKRVEQVLDKNLIAKVEQSQQQIEKTIQETLQRLEQAEKQQINQEQENKKINLTKRKSDSQSHHSGINNHDKEFSEIISQNQSFAESDFSVLTGNGIYATRQVVKKNYIITGKVPSRYNHDNLYPKTKSQNNSFHDNASNLSSSNIKSIRDHSQDGINNHKNNIQNKGSVSDQKDIIDEEEYQGDIKINRNVNLQKLLFVD